MRTVLLPLMFAACVATRSIGAQTGRLALVGGTLIDGSGGAPVPNAVVVVVDGIITAVGPAGAIRIPPGAERIDARDKYILPGFIDANVHLTQYNLSLAEDWNDSTAIDQVIRGLRQLASRGVTTVRDTYGLLPILLAAKTRIARDHDAARVLVAGNVIGWGDAWSYTFSGSTGGRPRTDVVRRLSQMLTQGMGENLIDLSADSIGVLADRYLDRGPDFVKIGVTTHTSEPAPLLFTPRALTTLVQVAHRRGRRVDVHAGTAEALRLAVLSGADVLQHPELLGGFQMSEQYARELVDRGVVCALMPRHYTGDTWARFQEHVALGGRSWPAEMPLDRMRLRADSLRRAGVALSPDKSADIRALEHQRANAELLIRVGCRVAVATDDLVGPTREMGNATLMAIQGLVELGMTPMQAIVAATRNGALAAGADSLGLLRAGAQADIIVLGKNPLEDIRQITALERVMLRGKVVPTGR